MQLSNTDQGRQLFARMQLKATETTLHSVHVGVFEVLLRRRWS